MCGPYGPFTQRLGAAALSAHTWLRVAPVTQTRSPARASRQTYPCRQRLTTSVLTLTDAALPEIQLTLICTPLAFSDCAGPPPGPVRSRVGVPLRTSCSSTVSAGMPALQPVFLRNSTV